MGEREPRFERMSDTSRGLGPKPIPTAGAIQVKNEKGQLVMKKVKVQRYVAGQVPKYAEEHSDEDDEDFLEQRTKQESDEEDDRVEDRRRTRDESDEDRGRSRRTFHDHTSDRRREDRDQSRPVYEPEVIYRADRGRGGASDDEEDDMDRARLKELALRRRMEREELEEAPLELEEPDEGDDEEEIQRRRDMIRMQQRHKHIKEEVQQKRRDLKTKDDEVLKREEEEEEAQSSSEEESSEEESESEEEDGPMLKPVFVKKRDRITLVEVDEEQKHLEELKLAEEKRKEERKKESVQIMQATLKHEEEMAKAKKDDKKDLEAVNTDDEEGEIAYEQWKVRELRRLKRNRDERETLAKEKAEIEKIHNMTEEERINYLRLNPKMVTNKQDKGKYKFLQKYYHRGAFFLDHEEDILKRNYAEATGDDEFDKSILPKVMQVKNFGKASRSKWTHLTAEDTTDHQGVWAQDTPLSAKFVTKQAGMKSQFDRPAAKKRRVN